MQSVFKFSDVLFALSQMDLPMDEALGQVDIFVRSSGQADLWSDVSSRIRLWVRLTFGYAMGQADLWSDVLPRIRQVEILGRLWVRLVFGQIYPPGAGFGSG